MAPTTPVNTREAKLRLQGNSLSPLRRPIAQQTVTQSVEEIKDGSENLEDVGNIARIATPGDLVLEVSNEDDMEIFLFRVRSDQLIGASPYFRNLLDPQKFQEGASFGKRLEELRKTYTNLNEVPFAELPRVKISYVGHISAVKSIKPLMTDFFQILHNLDLPPTRPPLVNIANLAIVADRFDATAIVARWMKNKWVVGKAMHTTFVEDTVRQRILAGMLFGHEQWVTAPSMQLLLSGSVRWIKPEEDQIALWWDLPRGLDEELQFRREAILCCISSLQTYILSLFTSKTQQCKLGYDSSPQCDSFQLGEFVRFLTRTGTLAMYSVFHLTLPRDHGQPFAGDIRALMTKLRSCPSYQIDPNHSHCGARKLLLTGLDFIQDQLGEASVGVCLQCWGDGEMPHHFWSHAKPPLFFNTSIPSDAHALSSSSSSLMSGRGKYQGTSCVRAAAHMTARDFFTAEDKNWEVVLRSR